MITSVGALAGLAVVNSIQPFPAKKLARLFRQSESWLLGEGNPPQGLRTSVDLGTFQPIPRGSSCVSSSTSNVSGRAVSAAEIGQRSRTRCLSWWGLTAQGECPPPWTRNQLVKDFSLAGCSMASRSGQESAGHGLRKKMHVPHEDHGVDSTYRTRTWSARQVSVYATDP